MNKLNQVKSAYQFGAITKAQFIEQMHFIHVTLFEYAEFIKGTDIKEN